MSDGNNSVSAKPQLTLLTSEAIDVVIHAGSLLVVLRGLAHRAGFVDGSEVAVQLKPAEATALAQALLAQAAHALQTEQQKCSAPATYLSPDVESSKPH